MDNEIINRIIKWFNGEPQPPFRLMLSITSNCNLRCKFCEKWKIEKKDLMGESDILEVIRQARKLGIKEVHISGGGEPFMRKKHLNKNNERNKEE